MEEISDLSGLSSSYVLTILKEKLKLQKICARWIPHLLTPEQKKDRLEKASVLLSRVKNRDSCRLKEVVTSCHTHPTALTSLPVISGLTHISNLAYEDVNLRRPVLTQLAFYVNLHRAVIGPSATLTGR